MCGVSCIIRRRGIAFPFRTSLIGTNSRFASRSFAHYNFNSYDSRTTCSTAGSLFDYWQYSWGHWDCTSDIKQCRVADDIIPRLSVMILAEVHPISKFKYGVHYRATATPIILPHDHEYFFGGRRYQISWKKRSIDGSHIIIESNSEKVKESFWYGLDYRTTYSTVLMKFRASQ